MNLFIYLFIYLLRLYSTSAEGLQDTKLCMTALLEYLDPDIKKCQRVMGRVSRGWGRLWEGARVKRVWPPVPQPMHLLQLIGHFNNNFCAAGHTLDINDAIPDVVMIMNAWISDSGHFLNLLETTFIQHSLVQYSLRIS